MLKIYKLPLARQRFLFSLLSELPENVTYKTWAKKKGVTKKEWHAFNGYLSSREYKFLGKPPRSSRKIEKKKKMKLESIELNKLPYDEYLKTDYWKGLRKMIKTKQKRCVVCNSSKSLNVHHRSYKHKGYRDKEKKDLFVLCRECHSLFHKHSNLA